MPTHGSLVMWLPPIPALHAFWVHDGDDNEVIFRFDAPEIPRQLARPTSPPCRVGGGCSCSHTAFGPIASSNNGRTSYRPALPREA